MAMDQDAIARGMKQSHGKTPSMSRSGIQKLDPTQERPTDRAQKRVIAQDHRRYPRPRKTRPI